RACEDPDRMTLVETVEQGWWYTVPLPQARRMVMCFARPIDVPRTRQQFLRRLDETVFVRPRLAEYTSAATAPRLSVAHSSRLRRPAGQGWVAIGDAAATHDPASSFGLTAALNSALRAASAIDQ